MAALFHGQVLNISSLARDAGVARATADGYLSILEDTLLAWRLPAFEARLRVRERRHPKLYLADAGVVRALKRARGDLHHEERGALFEGWLASVLRAYRDYRRLFDEWAYWRSAGTKSVEVDFVLTSGDRIVAMEAKSGVRNEARDLKGRRAIDALPQVIRRIDVYSGDRRRRTEDGIDVLFVAALLAELEAGSLCG